jgi:hypothetical protein
MDRNRIIMQGKVYLLWHQNSYQNFHKKVPAGRKPTCYFRNIILFTLTKKVDLPLPFYNWVVKSKLMEQKQVVLLP